MSRASDSRGLPSRRALLGGSLSGLGLWLVGGCFSRCASDNGMRAGGGGALASESTRASRMAELGVLGEPDGLGLMLPAGFTASIVAKSGERVGRTDYVWHDAPDGGAVFPQSDGWIYVSNSEVYDGHGGVSAIRFDATGAIVAAYSLLRGTTANCAGGPTPWGTWLSCEEYDRGRVYEAKPEEAHSGEVRPALGVFRHEAVAVDPEAKQLYLTEDEHDGRLYRFTPDRYPDLSSGTMEVLQLSPSQPGRPAPVRWLALPDPSARDRPTRRQVSESTPFNGGEGIWHHAGQVVFATKGDNRVWAYDTRASTLRLLYDHATSSRPNLSGVDNVLVSPAGDVLVAEDAGDMEIARVGDDNDAIPILRVTGQAGSEITGPALAPTLDRLYFSSQRGITGESSGGITYVVSGPFFAPA